LNWFCKKELNRKNVTSVQKTQSSKHSLIGTQDLRNLSVCHTGRTKGINLKWQNKL